VGRLAGVPGEAAPPQKPKDNGVESTAPPYRPSKVMNTLQQGLQAKGKSSKVSSCPIMMFEFTAL